MKKTRNLLRYSFITFFAIFSLTASSFAQRVAGDFEGDGKADLSVALVYRDIGQSAWLTRLSSGGQFFWTWNVPGDAFVFGRWYYDDNNLYPSLVRVVSTSRPLEWIFKTPDGQELKLQYGLPGDLVPNQADLDCDGVTDIIVVRNGVKNYFEGFKLWYVALSSQAKIYETLFGMAGDRVATVDMNNDGCHELLALREGFHWFTKPLFAEHAQTSHVQWGLPGDIPILPKDLNGDGNSDYIISRPDGNGNQTAFVRYSAEYGETYPLGHANTIPFAGDYYARGNGFAYWDRAKGKVYLNLPDGGRQEVDFGIPTNDWINADGTVITSNEIGRFGNTNVCATPKFPDGKWGYVWKPVKEGGSHTKGGPLIMGHNSLTKVELYDKSGNKIMNVPLRYRNGLGNRSFWDPTKKASELVPYAPLMFRVYYPNGVCEDRLVPNPVLRYD